LFQFWRKYFPTLAKLSPSELMALPFVIFSLTFLIGYGLFMAGDALSLSYGDRAWNMERVDCVWQKEC
jgi:hypothetical protein